MHTFFACRPVSEPQPGRHRTCSVNGEPMEQDGRGICLTLNASDLGRLVSNTPGLRINPVIYDRAIQAQFVNSILDRAFAAHQAQYPSAHEAAIAALFYTTPLMKAPGFVEEQEWRLVFMPPAGVVPRLGFHARRDFLAPYVTLNEIWFTLVRSYKKIPRWPHRCPRLCQPYTCPLSCRSLRSWWAHRFMLHSRSARCGSLVRKLRTGEL